jgi:hypothetical protein
MKRVRSVILFALATCATAQQPYRHPDGIYTLTVPAGWRATETQRGTVLNGPGASILISAGPAGRAASRVDAMQAFVCKQWKECKVVERGSTTTAGLASPWLVVSGLTEKQGLLHARLVGVSAREGTLSILSSTTAKDYPAMKPVFESVERSLDISESAMRRIREADREDQEREVDQLLKDLEDDTPAPAPARVPPPSPQPARTAAPAPQPAPAPALQATAYRDPRGRFQLFLPAGWQARDVGDATSFSRGDASLNVLVADGAQPPAQVVSNLSRQVGQQWQGFTPVQNGEWKLGGAPAAYGMFSGANPRGAPALMRIVAAVSGGRNYVLIASVPRGDWDALKSDLQRMEESLAFATGPAPPPARTPATAPAPAPAPAARPSLGLLSRNLTPQDTAATGATQGIIVGEVRPGSPAEAAGIRVGDVIISFARLALVNTEHLLQLVAVRQPGDVVEVVLLRAGKPLTLQVTLGARP